MAYGTLQIFDTIGAKRVAADHQLSEYDEDTLYTIIQSFLDAHNRLMDELLMDICEKTTEKWFTWGNYAQATMMDGDEFSRPDAQKIDLTPVTMGLPLYLKQAAYQVTAKFMQNKTIGDLEKVVLAVRDADIRDVLKSIRRTLFNPTNNLTYTDRFVDGATLPLRQLINADSAYIPPDMWGNTFDSSTHTHYSGTSSWVVANMTSLGTNVLEHYSSGQIRQYINPANESTVRGFTGFLPYPDPRIIQGVNADHATGRVLDLFSPYNRPIGILGVAEIWTKPWVPSNYVFCFNPDAPKPLRMRVRNNASGSLRIAAEIDRYPLRATFMEREYGIGVVERAKGAVLYTSNSLYAAPSEWSI
jgi:hypothetical protein